MKRPNKLDWMVYRIFRWWWNPIFRNDPGKTIALRNALNDWILTHITDDLTNAEWQRFEVAMLVNEVKAELDADRDDNA